MIEYFVEISVVYQKQDKPPATGKPVSEGDGTDIQEPVINRKSCLRLADSSFYFNIL